MSVIAPEHTGTARSVIDAMRAAAAVRRIAASTHGASVAAITRHAATIEAAHAALVAAGRRDLSAALVEEDSLAMRLQEARLRGQDRPELRGRLKDVRAALRAASAPAPTLEDHLAGLRLIADVEPVACAAVADAARADLAAAAADLEPRSEAERLRNGVSVLRSLVADDPAAILDEDDLADAAEALDCLDNFLSACL